MCHICTISSLILVTADKIRLNVHSYHVWVACCLICVSSVYAPVDQMLSIATTYTHTYTLYIQSTVTGDYDISFEQGHELS